MSVNKKEFADRMAEKGGIKKKDAMKGLELFIETLMDCMNANESLSGLSILTLSKIGKCYLSSYRKMKGRTKIK